MEAIGTLTDGIAHDFNNLLTIINGYTELILSERTRDDLSHSDLQKILETGRKGAELVQRLLALSKKGASNPQPLDLNRTVENSSKLIERTFPKMIEIETILEKNLGMVDADATQIEQVLMNLCINAREAMPDGGKLRIETKNAAVDEAYCKLHVGAKPGPHVLIEVADTGAGMDAEKLGRIFDPFFSTKGWDFKKGTGLGLSVAKGIVEQHGGWITCESQPGEGTKFTIYLPAIEAAPEYAKPEAENVSVHGVNNILLVDDEEYVRDLGKRILERSGYTVVTAANGKEALEIYARDLSNIALVVLDLIMPQMGGEQCLEELLKINPHVKVIVSTGHCLEARERLLLGALARGFVNKPYEMRELVQTVKKVLEAGAPAQ
jgi:CheY-like chemotaxis protein/two-component sensor histidine kinase